MSKKTKYTLKKEFNQVGPIKGGPFDGLVLKHGQEYQEGTFPDAYRHMMEVVKEKEIEAKKEKEKNNTEIFK